MESVCTQRGRETDRDRRVGGEGGTEGKREKGKEGREKGGREINLAKN